MIKMTSLKIEPLSSSLITEYLEMTACPGDRELKETRIAAYQKLLDAGEFGPVTWAKAFCKENGETYRINGKHTSVLFSRQKKHPNIAVIVHTYRCDTLKDVAHLYSMFDNKLMGRNKRDIVEATARTGLPILNEIPVKALSVIVGGIAYSKKKGGTGKYTDQDQADFLYDHFDFALWAYSILWPSLPLKCNKALNRQQVVAVMFESWSRTKSGATQFWEAVRDETGPTPKCPDRVLAKWLLQTSLNSGYKYSRALHGNGRLQSVGMRHLYAICLKNWNRWRKGEDGTTYYKSGEKLPSAA